MSRPSENVDAASLYRAYGKEVRRADRMVVDASRRRESYAESRKDSTNGDGSGEFSFLTPHEDRERKNMVAKLVKQAFLLGTKWEILDMVLKKGRFAYVRGKSYTELGSTTRKKIREILAYVALQLVGENDVDAVFAEIANGTSAATGAQQFRLNAEQIQWIKEVFAEEDAEHAYRVKETNLSRAKRQKFWTAAKQKASEESPEIHAFFEAFNGVHQSSWPTLGVKAIQARMEDIALRESEKEQAAKKRKREHCAKMSKLAAAKRTAKRLERERLAREGGSNATPAAAKNTTNAAKTSAKDASSSSQSSSKARKTTAISKSKTVTI